MESFLSHFYWDDFLYGFLGSLAFLLALYINIYFVFFVLDKFKIKNFWSIVILILLPILSVFIIMQFAPGAKYKLSHDNNTSTIMRTSIVQFLIFQMSVSVA